MSVQQLTSSVCPIIVGRTRELQTLQQHRDGAGPPILLLSGEAGIGKSRLVAETARRSRDAGMQVLEGNCYEADRILPYAPFVDLLRPLFTVGSLGGDGTPAPLEAELALLLPGLSVPDRGLTSSQGTDAEERKHRIFFALTDLVAELANRSPVLIVLEDLHWSDEASLDLLSYVARHTADAPIRFVLSYRSDEAHPTLPHVVAELERERLAIELALPRLTSEELGAMVHATLGLHHSVPGDVVHMLHRLTDGNPFFVEEALKSLVELGDLSVTEGVWHRRPTGALRIPRTVQDAVQRRTTSLTEAARHLLDIAAVTGHRFDFAILQHLMTGGDAELLGLIKELMSHQLVVEETADRFAFRHALTREAIYADLLARERRELHRAIAEAMEMRSPGGGEFLVADLAYHFFAAGLWDRALVYLQRAGEQALLLYAPYAAIEHFTRGLHACDQLGSPAPVTLYQGRGKAYEMLGRFEPACLDYEAARHRASEAGDKPGECRALLDLALLWSGRDYARVGDFVQRAIDIARTTGDRVTLAQSLNRLGNWYTNVERPREGMQCHQDALQIFEQLHDQRGVAETFDFLGMTGNIGADHAQSAAYYERAIPLLEEVDDRQRLVTSLTMWMLQSGFYLSETSASAPLNLADVTGRGERALQIARGMDWPAGEAFVLYELALWLGPRGEYGRAFDCARSALAIAEEIGHQQWLDGALCALGALHLDLLDAPGARNYLERALTLAREIDSLIWIRVATSFLVPTYLAQGEVERATEVLNGAIGINAPAETIVQRLCWRARAQVAVARGEGAEALEIVERLISTAAPTSPQRPTPLLLKLRAEALAALHRSAEAEQTLLLARDAATSNGLQPLLWRIHLHLGKLLQANGRRTEARDAFAAARTVVQGIAENIPEGSIRSTFLRRTEALLPARRQPSRGRIARERFGGLTAREREVAMRIAEGKSNRVIAEEMVVTERTVEGYVGNIFGKLGFSSRAQIAAWTVEMGLVHRDR